MAIDTQQLNEAINRASYLMSPEGQQKINYAGNRNKLNFDKEGNYMQPSTSRGMGQTNYSNYNTNSNNKPQTKLPKAILESIKQTPIYDENVSVLDSINFTPTTQQIQEDYNYGYQSSPQEFQYQPQPQYRQVFEQQYLQQPQIQTIDYNYIRSIINECIQNNLKQIKEELLKESALKTVRLGSDNKIQLIDNNNNLFESKLEFKKNISKK